MPYRDEDLPGVELPPLPEPDGKPGPYAYSGLRHITGSRMNPKARKVWYTKYRHRLRAVDAPVVTCAHPQLADWLRVRGGLEPRWRCEHRPASEWPLSRVIPRVVPSPHFPNWEIPVGTYWFDYPSITGSQTKLPEKGWMLELKDRLPEGSTAILGCIGEYQMRVTMWRFHKVIWDHPFIQQFDAVVCPDFSSYLDDPRPQALIGERMTQEFIETGYSRGFEIIPIISWQDETALRRQVDLLGALFPKVNTIYIELVSRGVDRTVWLFTRLEQIEKYLAHLPLRFIFSGCDAGWANTELHRIFPNGNYHLTTMWPWLQTAQEPGLKEQKARYFRRKIRRLEDLQRGENLPPPKPRPDDMTLLLAEKQEQQASQAGEQDQADQAQDA